jgi:thioesterase domain-containing protein
MSGPAKYLVPIRRSGSYAPLCLVHSLAGELTWLPLLAKNLSSEWPLYGFGAAGLNSNSPFFPTVEAMAAAYLSEIRALQPWGPYLVGGYSFGGLVAFEMTRQLHAAGERVDTLILLDAFAPGPRISRLLTTWADNGLLLQVVANLLGLEWKAAKLIAAGVLPADDPSGQAAAAARHLLTHCSIGHTFTALEAYLARCQSVMREHARLFSGYRPRPLSQPVRTLLLHNTLGLIGRDSKLGLPSLPEEDRNPDHGWDRLLIGEPRRIPVPAEHFMFGVEPAITRIAFLLSRELPTGN